MRKSQVKAKLNRGEPVLIVTLHLTDPSIFELTSLMGFDGIWMDLEHHGYSLETAGNLMRAARVGTSDIVARPAKGESARSPASASDHAGSRPSGIRSRRSGLQ